jgi:uncharacterized membrane protein YbaN (DUF454 family)
VTDLLGWIQVGLGLIGIILGLTQGETEDNYYF